MGTFGRTGGSGKFGFAGSNQSLIPVTEDAEKREALKRELAARQKEAEKVDVGDKVACPGGNGWLDEKTSWGACIVRFRGGRRQSYNSSAVTKGWN